MGLASHPPSQRGRSQQSSPPRLRPSLFVSVLDTDNVHSANSPAVSLPENGEIFKTVAHLSGNSPPQIPKPTILRTSPASHLQNLEFV